MTAPIFLFDISAYLHRAMYVVHGDGADGAATANPSNASFIRHACGMLANTMEGLGVQRMIVVCDSTEPSLRCDEYPAYKAERKPHYPVFTAQAPRFYDALREMSVAVLSEPRYEADDLIASVIRFACSDDPGGYVIVSSDKDLLAYVDDGNDSGGGRVRFYDPMKGIWIGPADVRAKFGIEPSQFYDYIGLVGDSADGIPGVKSFGAKTSAKLLREFDSLDEIFSDERRVALAEFCGKTKLATLLAYKDEAFMSRRLASPRICPTLLNDGDFTAELSFEAPAPAIIRRACG
jgi:DNA polymerase-1